MSDRRVDADAKNSTFSDKFEKVAAGRFFENHRQQNGGRYGAGGGAIRFLHVRAFTRSQRFHPHGRDLIRQRQVHRIARRISIGEDGPSQMALEDLDDAKRARQRGSVSVRRG
jgi:hypothetical protein